MKTIGVLGGMSWESSLEYYRLLNEGIKARLGGLHSAKVVLVSVDFAEVEVMQRAGDWDAATQFMIEAALQVELGGADFLVIATNTMHLMADEVQAQLSIPLLHIADATADAIKAQGLETVGLLGTRFTMEQAFYRGQLVAQHDLNVLVPDDAGRETVHRVIYDELVVGEIRDDSRAAYRAIISDLVAQGAQGIILGCTEIGLLVKPEDSPVPIFDTTQVHAAAAVEMALAE
ncbi:MAG: aspartate/glutamate racemase family protein [Anaerolineae bacterium]|nr:aspartate/glutamate racemase family protein [Anaerolineae bacterium]